MPVLTVKLLIFLKQLVEYANMTIFKGWGLRELLEFSLNDFTEFSDKKIERKKQCGAGTQDLLCKRQR